MSSEKTLYSIQDKIHVSERRGDLSTLPRLQQMPQEGIQSANMCALGDMHGNAKKLIHLLVENGVIELSDDDLTKISELYGKDEIDFSDIESFSHILERMKVNQQMDVCLIGDELSDRGKNDYFTLRILETLFKRGAKVEIITSSHAIEFLRNFENGALNDPDKITLKNLSSKKKPEHRSLIQLAELVKGKKIELDPINQIVTQYYLPNLKLLSYRLTEDKQDITIFSHTRINLSVIQELANELDVNYEDATAIKLAATIDRINLKFQKYKQNSISKSKGEKPSDRTVSELNIQLQKKDKRTICKNAVTKLIWSREDVLSQDQLSDSFKALNYNIHFVHGHDKKMRSGIYHANNYVVSIDDSFGKKDKTRALYKRFLARGFLLENLDQKVEKIHFSRKERKEFLKSSPTIAQMQDQVSKLEENRQTLSSILDEAISRGVDGLSDLQNKISKKTRHLSKAIEKIQSQKKKFEEVEKKLLKIEIPKSLNDDILLEKNSQKFDKLRKQIEKYKKLINLPEDLKKQLNEKQTALDLLEARIGYARPIKESLDGIYIPNDGLEGFTNLRWDESSLREQLDEIETLNRKSLNIDDFTGEYLFNLIQSKFNAVVGLLKQVEDYKGKIYQDYLNQIEQIEIPNNLDGFLDSNWDKELLNERELKLESVKKELDKEQERFLSSDVKQGLSDEIQNKFDKISELNKKFDLYDQSVKNFSDQIDQIQIIPAKFEIIFNHDQNVFSQYILYRSELAEQKTNLKKLERRISNETLREEDKNKLIDKTNEALKDNEDALKEAGKALEDPKKKLENISDHLQEITCHIPKNLGEIWNFELQDYKKLSESYEELENAGKVFSHMQDISQEDLNEMGRLIKSEIKQVDNFRDLLPLAFESCRQLEILKDHALSLYEKGVNDKADAIWKYLENIFSATNLDEFKAAVNNPGNGMFNHRPGALLKANFYQFFSPYNDQSTTHTMVRELQERVEAMSKRLEEVPRAPRVA